MKSSVLPKVVAIGGGTGLSTILRGLKSFPCEISAIVTVADDGGSSGRLRKDMGILPPGDIRNCIIALAEAETDMTALFGHRFQKGELKGHSFGNLFLAAMTEMTGDFQVAIRTMSRILAVKGKVLPATLSNVTLVADMGDGTKVLGETNIPAANGKIKRVSLVPENPPALDEAMYAIDTADIIVIGPGSLYTSIIPNLLVQGIPGAIKKSKGNKVYICNIMTQPGETDGYSACDHVRAIEEHAGRLFTYVVVNTGVPSNELSEKYAIENKRLVLPDIGALRAAGYMPITGDFLAGSDIAHHDSYKIARTILDLADPRNTCDNIEITKAGLD